jgi:arabinogalactan endo-1,4-beta-galactosidase
MVAVGNEISNGLLWPYGRVPEWSNIVGFVSSGLRAVKAVDPAIQTMIHLDNGGWYGMYRSWFDSYRINGGADFDWIGLSYYPFWHGTLEELRNNMHKLSATIGKPMLVAETSMAFTLEECNEREGLRPDQKRGLAANEKTAANVPYPMSPEGQCAFLRDLWEVIRSVPGDLGRGFIWWEPAWLPVKGSGWTTPEGLAYVREKGPGGNEWANQAMFDYDGRALPVLNTLEHLSSP